MAYFQGFSAFIYLLYKGHTALPDIHNNSASFNIKHATNAVNTLLLHHFY